MTGSGDTVEDSASPAARREALERLHAKLMDVVDLPTAPEIALKVLAMIEGEVTSTRDLANLISRDQVLTARLLSLAHSAFFAMQRGLTSVPEVVRLLGFGRVRDLVLSLSVWDAFVPLDTQARRRLWTHSATVAAAARVLAERVGLDATQAYTAGLLHDVGKLVLGYRVGPSYWDLLREATSEEALIAAEEREYGCQHATVGGWLLQVWHLPQGLAVPVSSHHAHFPRSARLEMPQLTAIADRLVEGTDAKGSVAAAILEAVLATAPGLVTRESWHQLYLSIEVEREALGSLFVGP